MSHTSNRIDDLSPEEKRALLAQLLREKASESKSLYPLSHGQRALWFLHQLTPESAAYNVSFAARIRSDLDIPALRRAFQTLVDRHASLRTTFTAPHGEPVQRVHKHVEVCFHQEDASTWSETFLNDRLVEEAHHPFDLERGPLLRVKLFTRSANDHILLLMVHHIAIDFWSLMVLTNELVMLYLAEKAGTQASLPPVELQYTDYVRWQAEILAGPEGEWLWTYWQRQLAGELPVLHLPTDRPRPPFQTDRGTSHVFNLDAKLVRQLKRLAKANGATLYMLLLAVFQVLLHRYSGQEDLLVGSLTIGRSQARFANLVGYFAEPIVLRANLAGNPTFIEFLAQVHQTVLDALAHQDYPFALLVERLQPPRNPSHSPLFQVMFNMPNAHRLEEQVASQSMLGLSETGVRIDLGELELELLNVEQRVALLDLLLAMVELGESLYASLQYNTDLFDAATIVRMVGHFQALLEGIVANPEQQLTDLPLLTEAERHQLLVEWNNTPTDYPQDSCIHQLFEAQVEQTPDAAVAAVFEDKQLSYQQLNRRANRLARLLVEQGVGPDVVVALLAERGIDLLTAMMAVFKAGGAYLPLDPRDPAKRLSQVLDQSGTPLVLAASEFVPALSQALASMPLGKRPRVLNIKELLQQEQAAENLPLRCTPSHLAYVIYTSGSTGVPKGAMVEHRGMLNHLYAKILDLKLTDADIVAQTASQCFDISMWQFLAALLVGGRVHIFNDEVAHDPSQLLEQVEREGISILETVPSLLRAMFDEVVLHEPARLDLSGLRWLILTGEALPPELCRQWLSCYPNVPLLNAYGPTECSDDVTHYPIYRPPAADVIHMPIGHPIANMRLYVLDRQLQPVPIGVAGELCVSGIGVGRGYLNDAKRTAEVFVLDPFAQEPGGRLYKTGDLARYLPDGNIEFLGRIDHQVKIRGFRVELGEIESILSQYPAVQETVVVAREDVPSDTRLVAYVVPNQEQAPTISELRSFVHEKLPDYMLPSAFVLLDALPLTPHGKVDRRALPAPDRARPELERTFVAPRTPVEEVLAGIWAELLGFERVGVCDNFFDLGGHSLAAIKLISRVCEAFQVKLPLRGFFETPTVTGLAQVIDVVRRTGPSDPRNHGSQH